MYKKLGKLLIAMMIVSALVMAVLPEASAMSTDHSTNVIKPMTCQYFSPVPTSSLFGTVTTGSSVYTSFYARPSWATRLALYLSPGISTNNINFIVIRYNSQGQQVGAIADSDWNTPGDKYFTNQPIYIYPSDTAYVKIEVIGTSVSGSGTWQASGLWFS